MTWQPQRAPSAAALLASGLAGALRHRLATRREPDRRAGPHLPADGSRPAGFTGPVGPARVVRTVELSLADLRAARRRSGATINDLYLTAVTRGLRDLLGSRGHLPGVPAVTALVPRDVRASDDATRPGNRTWTMFVPLPVGERDVADRLHRVRGASRRAKQAERSAGAADFAFDVAVSNVAMGGPHAAAGAPVTHHHATLPLQGENRLALIALSSPATFTVTVTADAAAFPDLDVLAQGIRDGFDELLAPRIGEAS